MPGGCSCIDLDDWSPNVGYLQAISLIRNTQGFYGMYALNAMAGGILYISVKAFMLVLQLRNY